MEKKTLGSFLTALRKANGMTQKELADRLNVSDKAVSRWERDENYPDLVLIPVIADIFGVTSDELLRGERNTERTFGTPNPERSEREVRNLAEGSAFRYLVGVSIASACVFMMYLGELLFWGSMNPGGAVFVIGAIFCFLAFSAWVAAIIFVVLYGVGLRRRMAYTDGYLETVEKSRLRMDTIRRWTLVLLVPFGLLILLTFLQGYESELPAMLLAYAISVAIIACFMKFKLIERAAKALAAEYRSVHFSSKSAEKKCFLRSSIVGICFAALWGIVFWLGDSTNGTFFGIGRWFFTEDGFYKYMEKNVEPEEEDRYFHYCVNYCLFGEDLHPLTNELEYLPWDYDSETERWVSRWNEDVGGDLRYAGVYKLDAGKPAFTVLNSDVAAALYFNNGSFVPIRTFTKFGADIGFGIWIILLCGIPVLYGWRFFRIRRRYGEKCV